MTDDEVEKLLPVVDEFIAAVGDGDAGFIRQCLTFDGRAPAIAVICAERVLLAEAESDRSQDALRSTRRQYAATLANNDQLRAEIGELRARVSELRGILNAAAGRKK